MTQTGYAISAYQTALKTTPPLQAVVLLYDGILTRIAAAAKAAREGNWEKQFDEVMRANTIINGLNGCLDMEVGGRVAVSLRDMYESVAQALMRSVGRADGAEACDKLAGALRETRDAWAEIAGVPLLRGGAGAATPSPVVTGGPVASPISSNISASA